MRKLIFGDPESIEYARSEGSKIVAEKLLKIVKCPFCKAPATDCFENDDIENIYGFNFKCKPTCQNSLEWAEKNGHDWARVHCDRNGRFYE